VGEGATLGRPFGTRRGNLCYLQTSISPGLSELLDAQARSANVALGEVAYQAVRALADDESVRRVRRRRTGNPVRRDIGFLPSEADDVVGRAAAAGYRPSAYLRLALERYLYAPGSETGNEPTAPPLAP